MKNQKISLGIAALIASFASSSPAAVIINEIYGGGGNSGAPFNRDFIELYNNGATAVSLNGWSIQYATSTGAFNSIANLSNFSLGAGQFYLIGGSSGANGSAIPTPDLDTTINLAATSGKVALANDAVAVTSPTGSNVVDFVGYGSAATTFEGTGPTPNGSNTVSLTRTGFIDTNQNGSDFTQSTPSAMNSVPEPSTAILGAIGALALLRRRR